MLINFIRKNNSIDQIIYKSKKFYPLNKNKILLVGMSDSPHFQKWIEFTRQAFPSVKILVFPSDRPRFARRKLINYSFRRRNKFKTFFLVPNKKLNFVLYYVLDIIIGIKWRSYFLARFVIKHRPYIIHFHEMQHGSYIFNPISSYRKIPVNIKKIISTWGSDLILYSWVDEHKKQIEQSLSWADIVTAERTDEHLIATNLGFKGEFKSPIYITLGLGDSEIQCKTKPSQRRIILVKGHQSDTGRALNFLSVLPNSLELLSNFEILVYSASKSVALQVDYLRNAKNIDIRTLPKVSHSEMVDLFQQARISISLSVSDGLPGVLVEAMSNGAFPIQSINSAASYFISQGKNGYIVDPWDLDGISSALNSALTNDAMVDEANELSRQILNSRYNIDTGVSVLKSLYSDN